MKNVLLIDSGSGGLNILKECVRIVPRCNFLMFCDTKNLPYGVKTPEELRKITFENLKMIETFFKFDIVILACNTLTCTCLEYVRKEFPDVTFIGTVPAIKPALKTFEPQDILVLATQATIENNVSIRKNGGLKLLAMPSLASQIDAHLDELECLEAELKQALQGQSPKAVVLGCTHYIAVKPILQRILGQEVEFFDSANGVARRLESFVQDGEENFKVQIMTSSQDDMLAKFWWWFNK